MTTKTFTLPSFLYKNLYHGIEVGLEDDEYVGIRTWKDLNKVGKCVEVYPESGKVVDDHDMNDIFLPCKCFQYVFEVEDV